MGNLAEDVSLPVCRLWCGWPQQNSVRQPGRQGVSEGVLEPWRSGDAGQLAGNITARPHRQSSPIVRGREQGRGGGPWLRDARTARARWQLKPTLDPGGRRLLLGGQVAMVAGGAPSLSLVSGWDGERPRGCCALLSFLRDFFLGILRDCCALLETGKGRYICINHFRLTLS